MADPHRQEDTGGRRKASPGTPPPRPSVKGWRALTAVDRLRGRLRQER